MYKIIFASFLLILSLSAISHDIRLAQFTIHVEEGQLVCDGRIDKEDFQKVLGDDLSQKRIKSYLENHLTFSFNSSDISFKLVSYELSKNWFSIRFELETTNHNPKDVEVTNTILSEEIEGHDNIMRFALHDKTRSFRLNEDRKIISFNY